MQVAEARFALAAYLDEVVSGQRSLLALLEQPGALSEALRPCFHGLQHYASDLDIREKDPAYRAMQEGEMHRLIRLLRAGATESEIQRISFLRAAKP